MLRLANFIPCLLNNYYQASPLLFNLRQRYNELNAYFGPLCFKVLQAHVISAFVKKLLKRPYQGRYCQVSLTARVFFNIVFYNTILEFFEMVFKRFKFF